jgi:hypothetical protein
MRNAILFLLLLLTASCSARHSPIYREWGEWAPSGISGDKQSRTAILDWSTQPWVSISIDGVAVGKGYVKTRLSPGKHQFEFADYPAEFGVHPNGHMELVLLANHVYDFRIEYCYWCSPRKYAAWVDDKTSGELIWGKRPDWPSWWL